MTLHVHTGARTDGLADGLARLLAMPLADPFAREVVVVPARGVERWLTQRLSHRLGVGPRGGDGVCAGVDFLSPRSLVAMLLDRDADDPWDPDRLTWPLLEVVDEAMGEPGFEDLSRHLGHGDRDEARRARRWAVARRLAGLFASYAVQRPRLVTDWREGVDSDGAGGELDADLRWQAELWRRVLARVDAPPPDERHASTVARLRAGGDDLDLPARLSLFGHTRLPATEVELLAALAEVRDVHLWLPQASPSLWTVLAPTAAAGPVPRAGDTSARLVHHPLLGSLGRDSRELRRTLGPAGGLDVPEPPAPEPPASLLGWLQHDLRANLAPAAETRAARRVADHDRSVQVHACHGAARQVDVLREVLVGLLEDDPTLEPRDILVMCPDIEGYAPLVSAAFGLADVTEEHRGHPAHQLRVRLADRAPGATNPLLGVAAALVELAGGRMTATQVLDLAATDVVRARFGFGDDELERITHWVRQAAVRWGYDADHRAAYGLAVDTNTWRGGLQRVLLGAAMSGEGHRHVGGTLPLDDVGDGDLELTGRLAEMLDRLHAFTRAAAAARTAGEWTRAVGDAVHRLTAVVRDDAWQVAQFDRELARIEASTDGKDTELRHADVRALLQQRLRGRPTRSNFRTGTLTVCTMVPMRSVPHRVVCLVGLDDGVFPRIQSIDGDDVLVRRPMTGERDVRSEDRQLLLDAIGAAKETLVVTYTGRGEHTGAQRPPAVPLGELLDALDRTATAPERVRDHVVVHHPLQPFDEANLVRGALVGRLPFSFDRAALRGARAARHPRLAVRELVPEPLAPAEPEEVSLADLHDFFRHPVKGFFRGRLRVSTPYDADEVKDAIPIALDSLEQWDVGDRLVRDVLAGADPQAGMLAEQLRGLLPPGALGVGVLTDVVRKVKPLVERGLELRSGPPRTLDVDIDLRDRRVTGSVDDVFGNALVTVAFSNLAAKQRFTGWLDALALAAGHPDENWTVHSVGKHRTGGQIAMVSPIPEHEARGWLRDLVAVYEQGLREPLPLPLKTSLAWAEEQRWVLGGRDARPDDKAAAQWETPRFNDGGFPREDSDPWHVRAFGEAAPYSCLACPVRDGEDGPHRLGHFAWRMWGPLLDGGHEQIRGA
ncbi:exodeoxyribonuclease V subunit gamma [Nocardioides gansuensis]|uniref:RecBCD enzyme subunit RecC n=1 Tax=Nocardioides gansuensis TaxID=2138300 RepID=A0A2T8FA49_9ACTN|nr:exodeoxyribonuclease V subunit gamma [Nocardioides gansuensis]PVG82563.1 exodeoxyribonuclease V subunit gamma [Nocardioides gansuensis]